ncbi:RNA recognition motif. family protein [Cryptosporidium muris RN66]|uniref:RNA recognition motif. family protein n=1 Tax=Cryptosporidium muris (strain RN66) TaxID=441375 RepID=B6ABL9_CRYMR|nr:RNA recognition motif. family protein [Cryptosporidium muris RN66]EEA05771.1 RNA recognition motif. family protein [Cryptosporidium muris RN66]|eukprot:XP_002140120.1 RNA recognition motif. family protein [Cryptosporidium muris RN66]
MNLGEQSAEKFNMESTGLSTLFASSPSAPAVVSDVKISNTENFDDIQKPHENMETEGPIDDDEIKRSIYIGNVDYGTKPTELQELFKSCGSINRITIMNDKRTGMPKGFAYLEFCEPEAVDTALKFDGAMFRGRQIKVCSKRKNIPGFTRNRGGFPRGRGRGFPLFTRGVGIHRGTRSGYFAPQYYSRGRNSNVFNPSQRNFASPY